MLFAKFVGVNIFKDFSKPFAVFAVFLVKRNTLSDDFQNLILCIKTGQLCCKPRVPAQFPSQLDSETFGSGSKSFLPAGSLPVCGKFGHVRLPGRHEPGRRDRQQHIYFYPPRDVTFLPDFP